ncbi:MAG: PAS domain S-box protein [Deltaproteobacteria bacterium]|nr:PAS domain S-box protein [Deltaproteobacteria bacterium]
MMVEGNARSVQVPGNGEGVQELVQAIRTFNGAAERLKGSYRRLKKEVERLNLEIEKKNAELQKNLAEKEKAQDYLRNILESLKTAVIVVDLKGRLTTMNKSAEDLVGVIAEEVMGKRLDVLLKPYLVDPSNSLKEAADGNGHECEIRWKAGEEQCLQIHLITSLMKDSSGRPVGKILLLQDVTNIRRLEDQLHRNNRMAAMGELAVKIAHDVRNSLGSIELIASLLRKELEYDNDKVRLTEHIMVSVRNLDHTIANLLTFTRAPQPKRVEIALASLLEETLEFIRSPLKYSNIRIKKDFEKAELKILGDRKLLQQTFFNVILNAMQSMEGGGELEIFTRTKAVNSSNWRIPPVTDCNWEGEQNQWVEIGFRDSGSGIFEEDLPKIFDPFFTKKERGAGLGLAIVHNIVAAHGGLLFVDSIKGKGSLFIISLPLLKT